MLPSFSYCATTKSKIHAKYNKSVNVKLGKVSKLLHSKWPD